MSNADNKSVYTVDLPILKKTLNKVKKFIDKTNSQEANKKINKKAA